MTNLELEIAILRNLERGRARIKAGWIKHALSGPAGEQIGYCALGGIDWLSEYTERNIQWESKNRLVKAMPFWARIKYVGNIGSWNDHYRRRKAHVIALYDRAIELQKARIERERSRLPKISSLDLRRVTTVVATDHDNFMAEVENMMRESEKELTLV